MTYHRTFSTKILDPKRRHGGRRLGRGPLGRHGGRPQSAWWRLLSVGKGCGPRRDEYRAAAERCRRAAAGAARRLRRRQPRRPISGIVRGLPAAQGPRRRESGSGAQGRYRAAGVRAASVPRGQRTALSTGLPAGPRPFGHSPIQNAALPTFPAASRWRAWASRACAANIDANLPLISDTPSKRSSRPLKGLTGG
jgi:hypothetical protein